MKRFICISLLSASMAKALACAGGMTHNYYLFNVTGSQEFQQHVDEVTRQNWIAYGEGAIEYGYNTDEFVEVAKKKGDQLMVSYVQQLKKYLDCSDQIRYSWDYPSKEEVAQRNQVLAAVRSYAQSKLGTRLRSQHALLLMRCNMLMNRHSENIVFWENTASKYIETIYKEMMQNIYAGALLKAGRKAEGVKIFAQQNDQRSLYTVYYKGRSAAAIREEYQRDPNSPVLPFLVQDFVNNTQEAYDAQGQEGCMGGKLFIRDISKGEAMQMCALARQAVSDGKTQSPALWRSAEAMLQWFFGDRNQSLALATEAMNMAGTERMKDVARVVRLYVKTERSKANSELDNFLADELTWLETKMKDDPFFFNVYDRLSNQLLTKKYNSRGQMGNAFMAAYCQLAEKQLWGGFSKKNQDHSSTFFQRIDTMSVEGLEALTSYLRMPKTRLDKWIANNVQLDDNYVNDLLATKYLRKAEWQKALEHLHKVPLDYFQKQRIVPYMAQRSYKALPWVDQKEVEEGDPEDYRIGKSQKVEYAQEMLSMENGFSTLSGEMRMQRAFDLAVRYYQSSVYGDAWYLTRYGKSVYDTLRTDEIDRMARAAELLNIAKESDNFALKEKAYYALAYLPGDPWQTDVWNDQEYKFEKRIHPRSRQYKALSELLDFRNANAARVSVYVSRCDVLKQFEKQQR